VIGLAAGFVCLSLSSVWLYYEKTFDRFHKDADRIYTLNSSTQDGQDIMLSESGNAFLQGITETIDPEATTYFRFETDDENFTELQVDSAFCSFFGIELVQGDWSFIGNSDLIALSDKYARKMFPNTDPIGQKLGGRTVVAVLKSFNKPTILKYDIMSYRSVDDEIDTSSLPRHLMYGSINKMTRSNCFWKFREGVDTDAAMKMLMNSTNAYVKLNLSISEYSKLTDKFVPIKDLHLMYIKDESYVSYRTMSLFCLASILIMLCSLVNILIFFINTLRGRDREAALRIVNGATMRDLIRMFSLEMSILVLVGLVIGMILVWTLKDSYITMADISMPAGFLIASSLLLMLAVFLVALLSCILCVYVIRRRTIQDNIAHSNSKGFFRKISVALQLFTGTLFAFITCVMLHQFNYLRNENWGVSVNDQAVITMTPLGAVSITDILMGKVKTDSEEELRAMIDHMDAIQKVDFQEKYENEHGISSKLESLPQVTRVNQRVKDIYSYAETGRYNMYPNYSINDIDSCEYSVLDMLDKEDLEILNVTVIDGAIPTGRPIMENEIVITENLSKKLGLGPVSEDPVMTVECAALDEFSLFSGNINTQKNDFHVVAVIKDAYISSFEVDPPFLILCTPNNPKLTSSLVTELAGGLTGKPGAVYMVRYEHGFKKEFVKKVSELLDDVDCTYEITFTEDQFFKGLEKEKHLKNLIFGMGLISIVISIFGVWSMISLACLERRREIAVRKVHGAKIKDILSIFTKEYGLVVVISMALAFITGYLIMHQWMQRFVRQATISWWIYAGLFAATVLVIGLTVIHKVLKTASENPAEVIKSE
jgi:ABC-type antimicrobial peptide transport system permease subunit